MKFGLFGGGFKPMTKGHFAVIEMAAKENDVLYLYPSKGDRCRPNEHPIFWADMENIWDEYYSEILPGNTCVFFVPAPVGAMVDAMYHSERNQIEDIHFTIYSNEQDMHHFDNSGKRAKLKFLLKNDLITFKRLPRLNSASGTKTRECLRLGLKDQFAMEMPEPLRAHASDIYTKLGGK